MADGGEDRNRALGNRERESIVVEAGEVQVRAATAKDQDGVVPARRFDRAERVRDALRGLFTLHGRREKVHFEVKPVLVFRQMAFEISKAGGIRGADDGQPVRDCGELQLLLKVHHPLILQHLDRLLLLQLGISESEFGIDVVNDEAQSI